MNKIAVDIFEYDLQGCKIDLARSEDVSPLKDRHLSISWDLMDGTFPQAQRHNSRNHSTSRIFPPFLGMADMDENLGDVVR